MPTASVIPETIRENPVVGRLQQALVDSYGLLLATQVYHWNVEGPLFYALHPALESQYRDLFEAVDLLAERIRALGAYAPAGARAYLRGDAVKLEAAPIPAERMIQHLIAGHGALVQRLRSLIETAELAGDRVTTDLATRRLEQHEQTAWMLRSVLR